jgi:ferredoxin
MQGDLVGIGSPCFGCRAPGPVRAYLRALPPLDGKRAFVFATAGAAPGRTLYDLAHPLRIKGADVVGGFLARGECTYPGPYVVGRFPGRPDDKDLDRARRFAAALVEHVAAERAGALPESRRDALHRGWGFYDIVALSTPDPIVRLLMPEPKVDADRCDLCRWCAKHCPVGNITLRPHPVLGSACIRCYHCLTGCPEGAYSANWALGDLVLKALYSPAFERWFGDLGPAEEVY